MKLRNPGALRRDRGSQVKLAKATVGVLAGKNPALPPEHPPVLPGVFQKISPMLKKKKKKNGKESGSRLNTSR